MDDYESQLPEEILNAKVSFGLVNQGHIPKIEKLLAEGNNWQFIAKEIGWDAPTAREYYESYKRGTQGVQVMTVHSLLAKAIELLDKHVNEKSFDRNQFRDLKFHAEKFLISTPNERSTPPDLSKMGICDSLTGKRIPNV